MTTRFVSTGTVARALGVSRELVTRRCAKGEIPGAQRTGPSKKAQWRVPADYTTRLKEATKPHRR